MSAVLLKDGEEISCVVDDIGIDFNSLNQKGTESEKIFFEDIIALERTEVDDKQGSPCLTIHFIQKHEDRRWTKDSIKITPSTSQNQYDRMVKSSQEAFNKVVLTRPKTLLILVNPIGGRGKAKETYKSIIEPLFQLAQISCEVIVSERPKHLIEVAENYDSNTVDGVIMLGGDGTFSEVINVMMKKAQKAAGVDYNDPANPLVPLTTPISMVPTGTGNGVSECLYGIQDVETSVLHIIRGKTKSTSIIGGYADGRLLGYCGCIFGLGFAASLLYFVDKKLRWMRTLRYLAGTLTMLFRKMHNFDLELTLYSREKKPVPHGESSTETSELKQESFRLESSMVMVFPFHFENRNERSCLFYPDTNDLFLSIHRPTRALNIFKSFLDMKNRKPEMFNQDFITTYQGCAATFRILDKNGVPANSKFENRIASVDGEIQEVSKPEYHVKVHENVIKVFSSE